jgi:dTDP-4-amino-4,6-dideoxygalactose transaminase
MQWRVPLSDLDYGAEEIENVVAILESKWLTMGEITQRFEQAMADYLGAKHAIAVASGTAALHLANVSIGLDRGDEVIVPSLTFVATANAVRYTSAEPVFADITSLDDFGISPESIRLCLTPRTKAITVMHYGGFPCRMAGIMNIARERNLVVIEDAAHAPGAELDGRKMGTWGDLACFSFFSNKNLATGEGGMIVTNRDDLAEKIRMLRSHGMTTLTWDRHRGHAHTYDVVALGFNYRIDEIRASLGLAQLKKLEANNNQRRQIRNWYQSCLTGLDGISIPYQAHLGKSSCHLFPILLDPGLDRRAFMDEMRKNGIQTSIHYPPIHSFSLYKQQALTASDALPLTEQVGQREVTLPLYPQMSLGDVTMVCEIVKQAIELGKRMSH